MKKLSAILAVLTVLIFCSTSHANITNLTYASDGDGAFVCTNWSWTGNSSEVPVSVYGDQFSAPGHLLLNVLTDSAEDPTLKIDNTIENDSTFAWAQFTVNLTMAVPFTVTNTFVSTPGDWGVIGSLVQNATFTGSNYLATVVYDTGAPIANDGTSTIEFGYWVKFSGSPAYTITQEMIPTEDTNTIPEPGTLGLVGVGMLLVVQLARRRGASRG
jgi:hypothetical protein